MVGCVYRSVACVVIGLAGVVWAETQEHVPADEHFKVEVLAEGFADAMEMAVLPDNSVLIAERTGGVKLFDAASGKVSEAARLDVAVRKGSYAREAGLLGITVDPNFKSNRWVYVFYSVKDVSNQRLARFTLRDGKLADEKVVLEFPHDREQAVCHEAGSLAFGPNGNLFLSTGDNTCPFQSSGFAPIDEREGRKEYDAQRSAGNTNDLRGKIIRIRPTADGGYEIPEGNLFPDGKEGTRPEIYAMGCRNPFRMSVDQKTGFVYWGEVGPDANKAGDRGSNGFDEINQARTAGNFGWPYFVADNRAYADFDFQANKIKAKFEASSPLNDSPNSTGLNTLPAATKPLWYYNRASACAGPVYYFNSYGNSESKMPKDLDGCLLIYDWTSTWMRAIKLDAKGDIVWNEPWLSRHLFVHPVDMEMAVNGEIYLLEYGSPWYDGKDGKLKKISYSKQPIPLQVAAEDPRMKGLDSKLPGTKLIAKTTCLACHMTTQKSIGPKYQDVANKYKDDPNAAETLANKILNGGVGVWGQIPMPPHPQHNIEQTRQMVDAILSLAKPKKKQGDKKPAGKKAKPAAKKK